jgi:hypothetical protein
MGRCNLLLFIYLMIHRQYENCGGEGGIRTLGAPQRAQRFSRPPRSTAPAPLRKSGARDLAWSRSEQQPSQSKLHPVGAG